MSAAARAAASAIEDAPRSQNARAEDPRPSRFLPAHRRALTPVDSPPACFPLPLPADAIAALKPALNKAMVASAASNAALDAVCKDMLAVYPAGGELRGSLEALVSRSDAVTGHAGIDAARGVVDEALAKQVEEKVKAVKALVDSRAHLRSEDQHYTEKLARISAGAADPASQKRVEENKQKHKEIQDKFAAVVAEIEPLLASLDADIAAMTEGPFREFISALGASARALCAELQGGLDGVPGAGGPVPAA